MENQDKLYNQFKDAAGKAEGKGFDRMEAVWNRVEEKLDSKKERKPAAWFKYAGVAALILLFATIGTFIFKDSNTVTTPHALPQNNVVTIDTAKVERTVGPSAEKPKEEVVVNEKTEKISVKAFYKDDTTNRDSILFSPNTKYARISITSNSASASAPNYNSYSKSSRDLGRPSTSMGYLTNEQAKEKISVGAAYSIEAVEDRANATVVERLQGQVAGLNIDAGSSQSGAAKKSSAKEPVAYESYMNENYYPINGENEVGTDSSIILRGVGSIDGNANPLFIVDGIPVDEEGFRSINKNEIESISILKHAAATSIYGNRGTNGVIVVTTRNHKKLSKRQLKKIERLKKYNKQDKAEPIPFTQIDNNINGKIGVDQEEYESFIENQFENPALTPLSTFSIDVDNASYTNIRRFLNNGQVVPKDAVRVEEMINFFKYQYPQPQGNEPFSINTEYSDAPWNPQHKLLTIGLQGRNLPAVNLPASNFVFLIDVSGSMSDDNKLPLLKQSMKLLVNQMRKQDKVAIVVYAGAAGLVLPSTSGNEKNKIIEALETLNAGGSTAGGEGIELAYKIAAENFIKNGNNRVILATDGDFNVGASSDSDMETLIEEKRKSGVFLTCLGYGMGNYKDSKMEVLADKGNGNYAYIDNMQEATRFLDKEFKGSMYAIAKDVKIQIEFNPKHVQSYRLIGYENRKLRDEDFANDAIDAGELGSGHTVTALYEIIPAGVKSSFFTASPDLKYSTPKAGTGNYNDELATIKFRHKKPDEDVSTELVQVIHNKAIPLTNASGDFKFSAAVAWFGLKLRDSKLVPDKTSAAIKALATEGLINDIEGYKAEFIRLVDMVK